MPVAAHPDDVVLVAIIVGFFGVITAVAAIVGPILLARQLEKSRRREKIEDHALREAERAEEYAREDEVAARAAKAADDLVESNKQVAKNATLQLDKLVEIDRTTKDVHILVNNNMTQSNQNELNATILLAAVLRRLHDPTQDDKDALALADARIVELRGILADRLVQQREVEDLAAARMQAT